MIFVDGSLLLRLEDAGPTFDNYVNGRIVSALNVRCVEVLHCVETR